ncbi:MAG TPA: site-2 protease family protein [Candidatus Baltobacteraceae bacterium]|jgi:Zn-dependent protease|nr:site-2 protease family protein [Candidatus Baltobacteraceae bacterium]
MLPTRNGSIHLFRLGGIDVYLHWSWFLVAIYMVSYRLGRYSTFFWAVLEYLTLFCIVLMHEFGHSLACRSVGGRADQIILWPLGGVAYVDPPPRPGATLWSIAAGPLVNLGLFPILSGAVLLARMQGWISTAPNLYQFVEAIWFINAILLGFNLLPVYPLDGGQILRSLLWFAVGRARSLMIASTIGLIAIVLLVAFAFSTLRNDPWLIVLAVFAVFQCWGGLQQARVLARIEAAPPHLGLACPNCKTPPPSGNFWICGQCRHPFDMFATRGVCPNCGMIFNGTRCLQCGQSNPLYAFNQSS